MGSAANEQSKVIAPELAEMDSKSNTAEIKEVVSSDQAEFLNTSDEKRLVRKIDRQVLMKFIFISLLPIMFISYGLQFLDKTSLSYAAILGLQKDLNLGGQKFSWTSSIFYIGYLAACYPMSLGFVKLPLGKYTSIIIGIWGIILTLHSVANGYAGLMVLRTFLGALESGISPAFSLITSMWYAPREHVSRHAFWYAGNASASIAGSMVAYGVLHYKGSMEQWKILFLVFGLLTISWGVALWFLLPDTPQTAPFLSESERKFAALRPMKFQRTTQTKVWSKAQFIETFKDPKSWWLMLFICIASIPNGGTTSFSTLIIKGFGYDPGQTILMGLPASAFQLFSVVATALIIPRFRNSRLITMIVIYFVAIVGVLMILLVPVKKKLVRLAGFWLVVSVAPVFPLMLSLFASNTAGFTKKSTTSAFIFIGYCVGNLVGPQVFLSREAPHYQTAYKTTFACSAIEIVMLLGFRFYLQWENNRRDKLQGVHIEAEDVRKVDLQTDEALALLDETDWENKSFRYVL
ncbi:putative transporter [Lachnellula suecica]|uniref:Putative transporter n=1 Tax=Lachnellula suecica TaxID=602035 RepID=A0A8T9CC60_9HELO|nr:putative transporter [Lachnellula suecica]